MKEHVFLRAFEFGDLSFLNSLRNDEEIFLNTCGNKYFISSEYDRKWIEDKIFNNQFQIYLAICLTGSNEIIGYLSLNNIDYRNRKAEWGGIIIAKKYANKGYANDAAILLIKFVFEELGLHKLYGYVLEKHAISIHLLEKLGFINEGLIHDFIFKNNKFHNVIFVSLLKEN